MALTNPCQRQSADCTVTNPETCQVAFSIETSAQSFFSSYSEILPRSFTSRPPGDSFTRLYLNQILKVHTSLCPRVTSSLRCQADSVDHRFELKDPLWGKIDKFYTYTSMGLRTVTLRCYEQRQKYRVTVCNTDSVK